MFGKSLFEGITAGGTLLRPLSLTTATTFSPTYSALKTPFSNVFANQSIVSKLSNLRIGYSLFPNFASTSVESQTTHGFSRFLHMDFSISNTAHCENPVPTATTTHKNPPPGCPYHTVVNTISGVTDLPESLILPNSTSVVHGYETKKSLFRRILGAIATILFVTVWTLGSIIPLSLPYFLFKMNFKMVGVVFGSILTPHLLSNLGLLKSGPIASFLRIWATMAADWFPAGSCVIVENPEALTSSSKPLMYAIHPHGVLSTSLLLLSTKTPEFYGTRMIMAPFMHYAHPIFKLLVEPVLLSASSRKSDLQAVMKKKENLAIIPGGFEEASLTKVGKDRIYFHRRTGYIYYAIRHGYDIVPIYMFGENDVFHTLGGGYNFRFWLNQFHIPAVLFSGFAGTFLPRPKRIMVVIGNPVNIPSDNESKDIREIVKRTQSTYFTALNKLFETYKYVYYDQIRGKSENINPRTRHLEHNKLLRTNRFGFVRRRKVDKNFRVSHRVRHKMVNIPKNRNTYCRGQCSKHTPHRISPYHKGAESHSAQGRRRYNMKQAGFGGQTKPIFRKGCKLTRKTILKLECTKCKARRFLPIKRTKTFQLDAPRKK